MLRLAGHDASTIFDQSLVGEDDRFILDVCQQEQRALVTMDLDFSDVRSYPPQKYHGLIVLRLRRQDKPNVLDVIRRTIPLLGREQIEYRLWIVEESRVRVRGEDD